MMTALHSAAWTTGLPSSPSVKLHVVLGTEPLDIQGSFIIVMVSVDLHRTTHLTRLAYEFPVLQSVSYRFPCYPRDCALQPSVVEGLCVCDAEPMLGGREVSASPHDAGSFHYWRKYRVAIAPQAMVMACTIPSRFGRLGTLMHDTGFPTAVGVQPRALSLFGRVRSLFQTAVARPSEIVTVAQPQPSVLLRTFAGIYRAWRGSRPPIAPSLVVGHHAIILETSS